MKKHVALLMAVLMVAAVCVYNAPAAAASSAMVAWKLNQQRKANEERLKLTNTRSATTRTATPRPTATVRATPRPTPKPTVTPKPTTTPASGANGYTVASGVSYDSKTYYGIMRDGKPDVFGVLANKSTGFFYVGGFKDGKYHTYSYEEDGSQTSVPAILLEANGNKWWADFANGKLHGEVYMLYDKNGNTSWEMQYRDGTRTASGESDGGYKLYDYFMKVKYTDETSGIKKIELYNEGSFGDDLMTVVKLSPNGSINISTGRDIPSQWRIEYDKNTGNWKYDNFLGFINGSVTESEWYWDSDGEMGYYNGELFDARYDANGKRLDGRTGSLPFLSEVNKANGASSGGGNGGGSSSASIPDIALPSGSTRVWQECRVCGGEGDRDCGACDDGWTKVSYVGKVDGKKTYEVVRCKSVLCRSGRVECISCDGEGGKWVTK